MFGNIDSQIVEASEESLLAAAGEVKEEVKDKGTKEKTQTSSGKAGEKSTDKSNKGNSAPKTEVTGISKSDLELAFGGDDTDDNEKEEEDKTEDLDNQDDTDEDTEDTDSEEDKDDEDTDKDDTSTAGNIEIKDFLKARVNLLVKSGEWKEFEGREDMEWDEDSFAEAELTQQQAKREEIRTELLDSFGSYGRRIAEFSEGGGDPDDLIDIFKEQQQVGALSIDTEDGQKQVLLKYALEFLDMEPKQAQRYLTAAIADNSLKEDAETAKTKMTAALDLQAKDLEAENKEMAKRASDQQKATLTKYASDVNTTLNSLEGIPADEKREIQKVLTNFDKKLKNGTPVNEFYFKFAEFRKNLPQYIQMVRMVLNPDKFMKSLENKGQTKEAEKNFKLLLKGKDTQKTKSSDSSRTSQSSKKPTSGFKLL